MPGSSVLEDSIEDGTFFPTSQAASATTASVRQSNKGKNKTIEQRYQKKTQIEHILLRPESYIGSVQLDSQSAWVWSKEDSRMIYKQITFAPGLFKIFDEILVNAADVKARETQERRGNIAQKMATIKVDIDRENNSISIYNDGEGIPIEIHKEYDVYVPELIFGHLLTSDNYDDLEERVTGGRNGYGAKLTNIFSTSFTVECADSKRMRKFRKTWKQNMSKSDACKITDYKDAKDYVKITFSPDLERFQMLGLDDDIVSLLTKRVYDIAGCCGVKVWLNGQKLPISDFRSYVDLYFPPKDLEQPGGSKAPIKIYEKSDRWEIVISISDGQFQQISFVNSICTSKGGTHVNYVTDPLVQAILKKVNTKNKGGMELKAHHVKQHLWVCINCLIVNPTFDSQTKETLTLKASQFGSKFIVSEKTITAVTKSEIVESVLMWARAKQQVELQRKMKGTGNKGGKDHVSGIPKLEDANDAGTRYSDSCTLILTEGESAKTSCVAGLSIVGKDRYGVFPLRGKLLNVREATFKQQVENLEIQAILKIMGLQVGKKIESPKGLRYGSLMIMTDQDLDGSHIKGLLINMIAHYWPQLLQYRGFLKEFVTPIVKCSKGNRQLTFFTLSEYESWKKQNNNGKGWKIKYYKGLGTSNDREFKEYFSDLKQHCLEFEYTGNDDFDAIDMAFNGKRAEDRKNWIQGYSDTEYVDHSKDTITYKDFIHKELVAFSRYDTIRSIPSCIDGLKPVQRKVLFAAFKRNLKSEIKVAQFIGYISEKTAYHHGEQSLGTTIIGMAQAFVGSNNINVLEACGQFGSRKEGGKDASAVRYIFTRLSHLARALFPEADDALLDYQNDDGLMVEPKYYIPVIPLVLANGAEGIGTGWSSSVPSYNPREIIANLRRFIKREPMEPMVPWYRGFKGKMERKGQGFESVGIIKKIDHETVEVTELPVKLWTQNFKTMLEELREAAQQPPPSGSGRGRRVRSAGTMEADSATEGNEVGRARKLKDQFTILEYRDNSSHEDIHFTIKLTAGNMAKVEKEGLEKAFKLRKAVATTNMTLFDPNLKVQRYVTELDIIREFGQLRLQYYEVRKVYLTEKIERERKILKNKVNFIEAIIEGTLDIKNRKKTVIVEDLLARHFDTSTAIRRASTLIWKLEQQRARIESESNQEEGESNVTNDPSPVDLTENVSHDGVTVPPSEFEYLLGMSFWSLSTEKIAELKHQLTGKTDELEVLEKKSPEDLWEEDLLLLETALDEQQSHELDDDSHHDRSDELCRAEDRKFKVKHRLSFTEARGVPRRRPNSKSKAKASALGKKKTKYSDDDDDDDDDDDESANSSSSLTENDSDEDDPFLVTSTTSKAKMPQKARTPKPEILKVSPRHTPLPSSSSPRPVKGFSLADRIKSRCPAVFTGSGPISKGKPLSQLQTRQHTLDELLGISSTRSESSSAPQSSTLDTFSPLQSIPGDSFPSSLKRPTSSSPEDPIKTNGPSPPKRQRRLAVAKNSKTPAVVDLTDSDKSHEGLATSQSQSLFQESEDEIVAKHRKGGRLKSIETSEEDYESDFTPSSDDNDDI